MTVEQVVVEQRLEIERLKQMLEDMRASYIRRIDESLKLNREIDRLNGLVRDGAQAIRTRDEKIAGLERELAEARLAIDKLTCQLAERDATIRNLYETSNA